MITFSSRSALVALATTAALLPAAPALAQTAATPTVPIGPAPTTPATPALTGFSVSKPVIDFGDTVDVTVRGTAGTAVSLLLTNQRSTLPRPIRTGTIGANGSFTWTGLRPEDTSAFSVRAASIQVTTPAVTVQVRRTVTIGIAQPSRGIYVFTGRLQRAEAGVQVTIARLDDQTKRVTGVASTRTTADGRYEIRTSLPQGLAGYYALTEARNGLEAGRSRLYGLLVNTTPGPVAQSLTLDVRRTGASYSFEGALSPARGGVAVTLAQVVGDRLQGLAGGVTEANGRYIINIQPPPGTYTFTVLAATGARSRNYGLIVPAAPVGQVRPVAQPTAEPVGQPVVREFRNCTEVRDAGRAPIRRGEPGFGDHLDRDGDGVGCDGS